MANDNYIDNDTPAFLCYAQNDIEAGRISSLLESYNIPVLTKRSESGGVASIFMGMSLTSVDIYVPSRLLDDAKEIVAPVPEDSQPEPNTEDSGEAEYSGEADCSDDSNLPL